MNSYDVDLNFAFKLGVINHFEFQIEILGKISICLESPFMIISMQNIF